MKHYPFANYEFENEKWYDNNTVMVFCTVTIGNLYRKMYLPVQDYKNRSITNPSANQINNARMRCLVKCIAMFGLGNYIYRGEDLPDATVDKEEAEIVGKKTFSVMSATNNIIEFSETPEEFLEQLRVHLKDPESDTCKKIFQNTKEHIFRATMLCDAETNLAYRKLLKLYNEEVPSNAK